MSSFNQLTIMGNLSRDPETRNAGSSTVTNFAVAVNRKFKTAAGESREEVAFIDVQAWGKTGETIAQYFGKGKPILLTGRIAQDSWEDKQTGQKRSKLYMVAEHFCFVGGKDDGGAGQDSGSRQPPRQQSRSGAGGSESAPFGDEQQFEDADIPF